MGYFDYLPDETGTTTTKKPATKKTTSFFDSLPDEVSQSTPEPVQTAPVETAPTKKKLTYKDPGYYDSEDFKNDVIAKYDAAPDKQKLKNTLTNLELQVLNEKRPENKNYSNPSIWDAEVRAKPVGFEETQKKKIEAVKQIDKAFETGKLPEGGFSWDELLKGRNETVRQIQTENAKFYREDGTPKGNIVEGFEGGVIKEPDALPQRVINTVGGKAIEYKTQNLDPALNKISEAWDGVGTYSNGTVKRLDNAQSFVKGAAGVVDLVFSPISFGAAQIGSDNPDDMMHAGNVINKVLSFPFEAAKGVVSTSGQLIGMDKQDADDLGTVIAAIIPFLKIKGAELKTTDISTIRNMANNTFTKIRDLDPAAKALWRQGARDLHPDVSGLPYTYMARFNDAAAKGDVKGMKSIIEEGKQYKTANPQVKATAPAYTDPTVMRAEAAKGNENAIIRNGNYQEAVKTTDVAIKDTAGNPVAKIETVGYTDGKVSVRVSVTDVEKNTVSTQFQGEYTSKEAAVKAGAVQTQMILDNNVSKTTVADLAEVKAQLEEIKNASAAKIAAIGIQARGQKIETKPKEIPQEDKVSVMQLSEWPYKGQFQVTVTEGVNKGKFAIGKTEEGARIKLEDVKAGREVTREPTVKTSEPSNKKTETKPASEPKKEVKKTELSNKPRIDTSKIRKTAQSLKEKAETELNRDRQDNTARRARMADNSRDNARADLEFANTLEKLADAADKGEVKHLLNVASKADLQRLERLYRIAENRAARELKKNEKDLTTKEIDRFATFDKTRTWLSKSDVERVSPSTYGKATKAGVDLKAFLKVAVSGEPFSIPKWEKEIEYVAKHAEEIFGRDAYSVRELGTDLTTYRALNKMRGESSFADLFDELKTIKEGSKVVETPEQALKRKERDLVQRTQIEGFFPTPEKTVERMIEEAGIEKGMDVLEPSAGIGSIADKIREAGVEPDVWEYAPSLSQHLTDKGYNVVASDFMDLPKSAKYDRILMNPPFERLQDVDHVKKAYDHLKEGGRVIAIMGESAFFNSTKKAVEFRDWLESVGWYSEKLPEGTFKESLRQTGVATRIVTIERPFENKAISKGAEATISAGKEVGEIGGINEPEGIPRRSNASALHTKGSDGISSFEKTVPAENTPAFKLSERIKELINELDTNYTRYVAPGSVGTFYTRSKNIALQSINDISTAQHELSHLIDDRLGVTEKIMAVTGRTSRGLPIYDRSTKSVRDRLTQIYVQYYPGAHKGDKLKIRMMEGYAVLQQKWLENPTLIKAQYPDLVKQFIEEAPDLQKQLNEGMRKISEDWQGLNANDVIGAVVGDETKNTKAKDFLNVLERIEEKVVDNVARFEKLDRKLGQKENPKSVSNLLYANNSVSLRIYRNIAERGEWFWTFKNGELTKIEEANWADLIYKLGMEGKTWIDRAKNTVSPVKSARVDTFSNFLIARDQVFEWKRLDEQKAKLAEMEQGFKDSLKKGETMEDLPASMTQDLVNMREEVKGIEDYLKRNGSILPRDKMQEMYDQYKDAFAEESAIFDRLVASDLQTLKDAGILSQEKFDTYNQKQGYAPMRRLIEDDVVGSPSGTSSIRISGVKVTKPKQLKQRTGGSHDIISPLLGAISNHREAMRKAYQQQVSNRLYDTLIQFPDLAQEVEIRTVLTPEGKVLRTVNGKDISTDPNVITKMVDGKPRGMAISEEISKPLQDIFTPTAVSLPEAFFVGASRLFSKGTTGIYPLFAITNTIRDQFTAMVHTKENYIPVVDQIRQLVPALLNKSSPEAKFAREYLSIGGSKITRLNFNEASGAEILKHLEHEETGLKKVGRWLESGLDILAIPANWSEIGTRMVEYVKARKAGKDMWTAFEEAGQVTAPFHHRGTFSANAFGRGWFRSAPYLNAIMQGIAQFTKSLRTKEGAMRYGILALGNAAVVMYAINTLLEESDDDTKRAYTQLDSTSLSKFIFIPKGNGELWKIPLPQEIAWLGAMNTMIHFDAKYGANYSAKEYVDAALSFLPDSMQFNDPGKAIIALLPQLFKPSLEILFNKKTFPVLRDLETQTDQNILPHLRGNKGTSTFATWFAQKAYDSQGLEISPIKIDHLLEGYFGRVIGYATGKPSAYDPQSPIKQPEYFTSGRMLQKFFDLSERLDQEYSSAQKGLIDYPDEKLIEINAKRARAQEIWDAIKEFKNQDEGEANKSRAEVWKKVNELLDFDAKDITQKDVKAFETKQAKAEWKNEKADIVERYVQKFQDSTDTFKRTRLEKELKAEIQGDAKTMTEEQKSHYTTTVTALRKAWAGSEDSFVTELNDIQLNADKAERIVEKRAEMLASGKTQDDFMAYMRELRRKKAISEDLMMKVNLLIKKQ